MAPKRWCRRRDRFPARKVQSLPSQVPIHVPAPQMIFENIITDRLPLFAATRITS